MPTRNAGSNRNAVVGLFVFNVAVTALLGWVGIVTVHGFALWPVVILHATISAALLPLVT